MIERMSNSFVLTGLIVDSIYLDRVVFRCTESSNYMRFIVFESNNDSSGACGSSVSLKPAWVEVTIRYKGSINTNIDKSSTYDVHLKSVGILESVNANLYRVKSMVPSSNANANRESEHGDHPSPDREEVHEMITGYVNEARFALESLIEEMRSPPFTIAKCDTLIAVIEFLKKNNMYN